MAPMIRRVLPFPRTSAAPLLAAVALAFLLWTTFAVAQGLPNEHDIGPQVDDEAGDGPPIESDTPEPTGPGKTPPGQSGLPVPRFASLRSGEVNVRAGPGVRYPVEWVFQRRGLPIEITAEFGTWRRVRDGQGGEGWVHRSMLSGRRTASVAVPVETLHRRAAADSAAVARAEQGVVVSVRACKESWCEVESQGFRGWLPQTSLWGVYPHETIR
jgi:SH3-like domain-containing protein